MSATLAPTTHADPVRAAFVLEQTLGHVTHGQNLRAAAARQADVAATWLPIPFEVRGHERLVPLLRTNWSVRASWRARRALRAARQSFDVLFFHTQVASLFAADLMQRTPTVISLDATPINYDQVAAGYNHRAAGNGFADRQAYRLNRRAFHSAARLVCWSEWARASLVADYGVPVERIQVLAPGAADAYFDLGARRTPRIGPRPARILFVGGDFARKGGPLLLDAVAGLDGCELHLVTGADVTPRPNVYVHRGLTPNSPALLEQFAQADIFVLPTTGECLSVALMEAAAAGLPIVTTDVGALREALVPGESGTLLPPGDGAALRQALAHLVADPALRLRQGRAAYALAETKFHATRNNLSLLGTLAEVASAGVPARRRTR